MAEVPFVPIASNIEGALLRASSIGAGDSTAPFSINDGNADVTVHLYGTMGGTTFTVQGSLAGQQYSLVQDVAGDDMSYTSVGAGVIKSVAPALNFIKGVATGGSGVVMTMEIYVVKKGR